MRRQIGLGLAAVALLAFRPASLLILGSSTTTTEIAGGSGPESRLIGPEGDYQGLIRVAWAEDADVPCYFKVMTRHINQNTTQTEDANLGGSSCEETDRSARSAGYNTAGHFVTGIAVCRNNGRIKGVNLAYSSVSATGAVTPVYDSWGNSDSQVNCTTWGVFRHCQNGKIATRIKVYHTPENPAGLSSRILQSATGIALICRSVEPKG